MGKIVPFSQPRQRARLDFMPKTASTLIRRLPLSAKAADTNKQYSGGILDLRRHMLTADFDKPARTAVATVPPSASIASEAELITPIALNSTTELNKSRFDGRTGLDFLRKTGQTVSMLDAQKIGRRLAQFRCAWNLSGAQAAHLCEWGNPPNKVNWSNSEKGLFIPPVQVLDKIRSVFGIPLEWFYYGEEAGLRPDVAEKLAAAALTLEENNGTWKKKDPWAQDRLPSPPRAQDCTRRLIAC